MNKGSAVSLVSLALGSAFSSTAVAQTELDRTILPIQEPKRPFYKELDARNASMPPQFQVKAPAGPPLAKPVKAPDWWADALIRD